MKNKILFAVFLSSALISGYAMAQGKNLKVLPKDMPKKEIKSTMKGIAKSLGVQCDHCHDTKDMAKDTEKKEIAREMMKMSMEINKKYFKGEQKVTCNTCHRGSTKPK